MGHLSTILPDYKSGENIFIETGTYLGAGLDFALNYPWKKMYSCELLRTYYDLATTKYNSVELHHANSPDFLRDVLPTIDKNDRIVFWLDVHLPGLYSNIQIDNINTIFPLEEELNIIYEHRKDCKDLILCDDLRIYIQANFEGGNIETPLQKNQISDFKAFTQWSEAHEILGDLRNEGYLVFKPK